VKIGIAGLRSVYWPRAFADYARQIGGVELVAAATAGRSAEDIEHSLGLSPEEFAERYAVHLYDDPVTMARGEGLDAAFVCAEHSRMVEIVEALAPLGVNLYVAKPMGNTIERARRVAQVCDAAGITATTGNSMRFDAGLRAAKQRITAGEIGDVLCVRVMHQHGDISGFPPRDWYWNPDEGGPELSLGWYVVDALRWLGGSDVQRVYAEYDNFASKGSPFMDNGKMVMRLCSGAIASADIYFSTRWSFPRWEIEVVGSKGAIKTMQTGYEGMLFSRDGIQAFQHNMNDMVLAEIADWVDACRNHRQPEVTMADAVRTLEACFAARDSAGQRMPMSLPCG
jgi:myo-inositol 2-dehydrogenase / D-chiro-inositol 1-dehydrogenase